MADTLMRDDRSAARAHVLVVSGDPARAARRCAQLTLAGWTARNVDAPVEVLAAVRVGEVDLVLLDMSVNASVDMDLPNVLRRVSPFPYLPVMILADVVGEDRRCDLLDSGADDIVSDGTPGGELVARAGALLRLKGLNDELAASRADLAEALTRERQLLAKLRRDNAELRLLCTTDPLTRVQNVRSFHNLLEHEFKIARRYNQSLSLLMLDLDHFKVVNDTHGHPSGDYVLKELAVILEQSVRQSDVVGRTGGEEFSILLPKADRKKAAQFARRIRKEVRARQFAVYGRTISVTVSIGVATCPADAEITEADMFLYCADQALLIAKESGRDRVVAYGDLPGVVRQRLARQYAEMPLEDLLDLRPSGAP